VPQDREAIWRALKYGCRRSAFVFQGRILDRAAMQGETPWPTGSSERVTPILSR
jgi:hypothetical protein